MAVTSAVRGGVTELWEDGVWEGGGGKYTGLKGGRGHLGARPKQW
jgi:hypothetical protein